MGVIKEIFMANFYTDNPDLKFHPTHPLMKRIVELKERKYTKKIKTTMLRMIMRMQWIVSIKYLKLLAKFVVK